MGHRLAWATGLFVLFLERGLWKHKSELPLRLSFGVDQLEHGVARGRLDQLQRVSCTVFQAAPRCPSRSRRRTRRQPASSGYRRAGSGVSSGRSWGSRMNSSPLPAFSRARTARQLRRRADPRATILCCVCRDKRMDGGHTSRASRSTAGAQTTAAATATTTAGSHDTAGQAGGRERCERRQRRHPESTSRGGDCRRRLSDGRHLRTSERSRHREERPPHCGVGLGRRGLR